MNAPTTIDHPLTKLRVPFAEEHVSKLPKESRAQIDARKADRNTAMNCKVCGSWHHKAAVHLDYVGHAALTHRLLDTDIEWSWEPVAFNADGLPALDRNGGLWIRLTVCGVTRLGYGAADGKQGGDAIKEIIGDALRNAAMRFGAALDLWHKGDLHAEEESEPNGTSGDIAGGNREMSSTGPLDSNAVCGEQQQPRNWGGRYPTKTALKKAMHVHHAELERLGIEGTFDDLDTYLTAPEYKDFISQATEHAPYYLDGERHPDAPPEFIQTFKLEQKARDMIAIRGSFPEAEYITERTN